MNPHSPDAKVVVIGCYAQLKPKEISEIPGVDLVLGAAEKFNILNYVDDIAMTSGKGMVNAGGIKEVLFYRRQNPVISQGAGWM